MSPNRGLTTALKPKSTRAQTACSRDEPVPKFGPGDEDGRPGVVRVVEDEVRARRATPRRARLRNPCARCASAIRSGLSGRCRRRSGRAGPRVPVTIRTGSIAHAPRSAGVAKRPSDRGGRGHGRRDEMGAAATALTALEVAVGGRGAALAGRELVGVHAEAHRATALAPLEARPRRRCGRAPRPRPGSLTWREPGTTSARRPGRTLRPSRTPAAVRRSSIREFVHEPMNTVSTSTSRIGVPGVEAHVGERTGRRLPLGRSRRGRPGSARRRRSPRPGRDWCPRRHGAGSRPPRGRTSVSKTAPVIARRAAASARPPAPIQGPCGACGRPRR